MDIVTHALTGLLVARASTRSQWGTAAVVAGALGPDLDVVASVWDPLASLTIHRGVTHSFLGGLALALVAGGLLRALGRGMFWRLAALAYLGVLSHIALDLFTPFGLVPLWPLDTGRWAVPSLYMIDPIVASVAVAGLIPWIWWKRHGMNAARAALLVLVAYLMVGEGVMRGIGARWAEVLAHQGVPALRATVVPAFPGPLRWVGVAETPQGMVRSPFWAWRVTVSQAVWFRRQRSQVGVPDIEGHWAVQAFLKMARFPWRTVIRDGKAWIIEYRELAHVDHPFGGPMALRLKLDPSGALQALEFDHRL